MKKAFHTNAFVWAGQNNIIEIAKFAKSIGYDSLEVGPGIPLNRQDFLQAMQYVDLSAFIYCRNFIDDDETVAKNFTDELFARMEFASSLGVKKIVTSTGISKKLSWTEHGFDPEKSLDKVVDFLNILVKKAEELDMVVCLENCPMQRNIATSPYMWKKIFERVKSDRLGICYDPGHYVWQMIDVYRPFTDFADKIYHIHIKDTEVLRERLALEGIMHNTGSEKGFNNTQWWRHTIIGDGEIDWKKFLECTCNLPSKLIDLSVEMEDYKYEGVEENVKKGLTVQLDRLNQFMNCIER